MMASWQLCAFADEAASDLEGQIKALQRNQISGLEVRGVNGRNITQLDCKEAKELRHWLDDAGIRVWSVGSPIGKIGLEENFQEHLELLKHTLELGEILNAQALRMFSFYLPKDQAPGLFRGQVMDWMGAMLEIGSKSSILFCHENEKGIYGATADRCAELLRAYPQMRAVFDPANFVQCGKDPLEAWKQISGSVLYMHMKDSRADGTIVPVGQGIGCVPQLLQMYRSQGGSVLTLEPHLCVFSGLQGLEQKGETSQIDSLAYPDSDAAFDAAAAALRKLL